MSLEDADLGAGAGSAPPVFSPSAQAPEDRGYTLTQDSLASPPTMK
jgi:hypothetical protein